MKIHRIKNILLLRKIAYLFPFKNKLNFLISKYLFSNTLLSIPYFKNYTIIITSNQENLSTLNELIFAGPKSQPEYSLIKQLQQSLLTNTTMLDIGGNIGTFTAQFYNQCKVVYTFEPIPRLYNVIENSLQYNQIKNVQLIKKALGNTHSTITMLDNNNSSIVDESTTEPTIKIEVTTLDSELKSVDKIDFIKIDVEGFEMHVLQGAEELINKFHPTILLELHPRFIENYGYKIQDVINWLQQHNYKIQYYSFLDELRQSKFKRLLNRWKSNPGKTFSSTELFINDTQVQPYLTSYHLLCE